MNNYRIFTRYLFRILPVLIVLVLVGGHASDGAGLDTILSPAKAEPVAVKKEQPAPPKITIPNLITYGNRLAKELIDMHKQLVDVTPSDKSRKELVQTKKIMESLNWDALMLQSVSNLNYKRLSDTMNMLNQEQSFLNNYTERLNAEIKLLSQQQDHWLEEHNTLKKWLKELKHADSFSLVKKNIAELENSIDSTRTEIEKVLREATITLNDVSGMQVKLYSMKVEATDRLEELREQAREQTSPTVFNQKFYSRLNSNVLFLAWQNVTAALKRQARIMQEGGVKLMLVLAFPIVLSLFFIKNKKHLQAHPGWYMLSERPVAFAIFSSLTFFFPWLSSFMPHMAPIYSIIYILSVMRLAGKQEEKEFWVVRFIYYLSLYLIVTTFIDVINLPTALRRIYLLVGSSLWMGYVLWRLLTLYKKGNRYHSWFLIIISLALTAVIIAGMFGYDELGYYLFRGVFLSIFLLISSVILFKTITILLEVLLALLPVLRHPEVIVRSLRPLVFMICVLSFYSLVSVIWHIFPTSQDALSILFSTAIPLGSYTLTMKTIFIFVSISYGTILLSRAVQTLLIDDILPRYNIHKGVQLSITRLVNYAILIIGGLILLQVMGASLTNLTILGGALSVGIGFGLQTIVNNFASGLILLFERPIKVGDTIELATELGKVKKLGLRSTTIQTFDNAEIVIPNSDLISGQVTNWTLAERRARLKIPVGVAYGSDIEKVLEVLLRVADEHPMALSTPKPRALFLNFGASSLDFELRVWVADFDDRRQVQSQLNLEINSEFTDAGIEIPFPQTDLHIRSVDDEAAEALRHGELKTA